jgi:hypothetical protein
MAQLAKLWRYLEGRINGETHRSCAIKASMVYFDEKVYLFDTSPVYTRHNELFNSQKRLDATRWLPEFLPRVDLATIRVLIYYNKFPESTNTSVELWGFNQKSPARWPVPASVDPGSSGIRRQHKSLIVCWLDSNKVPHNYIEVCISVD